MEILTSGRDEVLKRLLDGLSALTASAETIKHEEENFLRFSAYMIHVSELLRKLQSQQVTGPPQEFPSVSTSNLLLKIETEVSCARELIDRYKSKSRLFRPFLYRSVVSKLNQSFKEIIYAVLQVLPLTNVNTALSIKSTTDAIVRCLESMNIKLASISNAIISSLDAYISENSANQLQLSLSLFMISRSKGTTSSVCPLPIQIEALVQDHGGEPEGGRPHLDSYHLQTTVVTEPASPLPLTSSIEIASPPSSFFLCPLTGELLEDPVSVSCDHSFERAAIEDYFHAGQNLCPLCSRELSSTGQLELTSNSTLRKSILEWKKWKEQANAEENAKKKLVELATKISLDNLENTNQALNDVHALMMEVPHCISVATDRSCKLVPKLAELLKYTSEDIFLVLGCLLLVARFSDKNKEILGRRGVIQCLLKLSMTEPNALSVLLELSMNRAVARKIGGTTYSVPILISFLDNPNSDVAEISRMVLQNLSIDTNFTVMMAKFGYFTTFLEQFNSQDISEENRAFMAVELSQMQLTETAARNFENELFIDRLIEMLNFNLSSSIIASLNCIKHFITFDGIRTRFLSNESTIPSLLCLITTKDVESLKQDSLEILISLIQTTHLSEYQSSSGFQELFSPNNLQNMLEQIKTSTTENQASLLRLLLFLIQKSKEVQEWIIFDHNAMSFLFSAIMVDQNNEVKTNALKLISYIAENHHTAIPLPSSPSKESIVHSLMAILTEMCIDNQLAATSIISHLPPGDKVINEMLQSSAVLKTLHILIGHAANSHILIENSLGVLQRCINQSDTKFKKKVSNLFWLDLMQILCTGSPLAKQQVATILAHLSHCTMDSSFARKSSLSSPFTHQIANLRRLVKEENICLVHGSSCSSRVVCLVMDKAVKPLVENARIMESGCSEAALMAIGTLFDDGCDFNGAVTTIVESDGVAAILEVLEKGGLAGKEKALELFSKVWQHPAVTEKALDRVRGLLLNIVRKEEAVKGKAEKMLRDLVDCRNHRHDLPLQN